MSEQDPLVTRLRRIEGQVGGLIRMVEEDRACEQLLTQLLAIRAALQRAGLEMINRYVERCLLKHADNPREMQDDLRRVLELLLRMG